MRFLPVLAVLLPLAACVDDGPPPVFTPPSYSFLTPLRLNVASVDYAELPPAGPLDPMSPLPPGPALQRMAQDRLGVGGSSGRALVTIEDARVTQDGDALDGAMAIRLDIITVDGTRAGFAEARVARRQTGVGRNIRAGLYAITKQMLDDMNVEFEFQLRRSLRDYLQTTTIDPASAPVQREDLPAPAS